MKTIVVSLLKGGVGKTFLATHLAWYLAEPPERRVAFVDLDPQGSSTRRLGAERQGGFAADLFDPAATLCADGQAGLTVLGADPRLQMVKAAQDVRDFIGRFPALRPHFDYCVIDTGPKWDELTLSAMAVADAAPFKRFGLTDQPALLLGMDALRLFDQVQIDFANRQIRFSLPDTRGVGRG